jgi:lipoprotein-releasing system permease protein
VGVVIAVGALLATILLVLLRFFSVFTTVSTVGVMLGVASLIVVLSVTSGFQHEFEAKVQSVNAHLLVTSYGLERDVAEAEREARKVRAALEGFPGLVRTTRFSFTAGEVMIGKIGANLKGVELADGLPELRRALTAGSVDDLGKPATCPGAGTELVGRLILGADLARKAHAALGDCIQVLVPFSGAIESTPSAYTFRVVGLVSFGFQEYDARLGFIPLEDASRLGNARQSIFGVELRFQDPMLALRMEEEVENRLGPDRRIIDWKTLNKNLFTALAMQKLIISLLLVLIIVVAAFNILSSLMLVVLSKVRQVAILAAMGARRGSLLRVFLVSGSIVGFVGTGLGIAYGLALCGLAALYGYPLDPKVYLIARLPVEISAREILLVAGATQLISLLATLYPANRASRQQVVNGLKYV